MRVDNNFDEVETNAQPWRSWCEFLQRNTILTDFVLCFVFWVFKNLHRLNLCFFLTKIVKFTAASMADKENSFFGTLRTFEDSICVEIHSSYAWNAMTS